MDNGLWLTLAEQSAFLLLAIVVIYYSHKEVAKAKEKEVELQAKISLLEKEKKALSLKMEVDKRGYEADLNQRLLVAQADRYEHERVTRLEMADINEHIINILKENILASKSAADGLAFLSSNVSSIHDVLTDKTAQRLDLMERKLREVQ